MTSDNRRESAPTRTVVIYHFFPHYRKAVVDMLAQSETVDFTFVGDDRDYLRSIAPAKFGEHVKFRLARTRHLFGPFMWQWGAISWAIRPEFDVVVMHAVPHWPCTWAGALLARLAGKRVIFWGHGYLYRPVGLKGLLRRLFYAIPHAHMVYGDRAKLIAESTGWPRRPVTVIYNSLDSDHQRELRNRLSARATSEVRQALFGSIGTPVVICPTRLIRVRRLDLLIEALALLAKRGAKANLILVGDGPERARLEQLAQSLDVSVHFEGECFNEERIAHLMLASNVTVAPGKVGLTAMHSMAYGVPVVTHSNADSQMPEAEAVVPGVTGSLFSEEDVAGLARSIAPWIASPARDASVESACVDAIERTWNPRNQRRLIEGAIREIQADD